MALAGWRRGQVMESNRRMEIWVGTQEKVLCVPSEGPHSICITHIVGMLSETSRVLNDASVEWQALCAWPRTQQGLGDRTSRPSAHFKLNV